MNEEKIELTQKDLEKLNGLMNRIDPNKKVFNETRKLYEISKKYEESHDINDLDEMYDKTIKGKTYLKDK